MHLCPEMHAIANIANIAEFLSLLQVSQILQIIIANLYRRNYKCLSTLPLKNNIQKCGYAANAVANGHRFLKWLHNGKRMQVLSGYAAMQWLNYASLI